MSNNELPYRLRVRLLIGKPLTIEDPTHTFSLGSQEMVLRSRDREMPLKQASWLVMETGGFPSEEAAYDFGKRLKLATMHSALRCNTGVDLGHNVPTSGPSKHLKDLAREAQGLELRSDVHGLDVFPDLPSTMSVSLNARGTVSMAPGPFLQRINEAVEQEPNLSPGTYEAIVLLNVARARDEPLSSLVLAISAVELLGQSEEWSAGQKKLLVQLAEVARNNDTLPESEAAEVADAIGRSLHRISIRQGVLRVLDVHDLNDLKREWDHVYGQRSTIFHGTRRRTHAEYSQLADEAVRLCSSIVLAVAEAEGLSCS